MPERADSTDPDEIAAVIRCFFAAFTSGGDVDARLDALRAVLLPEAVIVRTGGQTPAVYGVETFIAPRRTLLTDGSLTDFVEREQDGRIEVFGDIAHWFGHYCKTGSLHGADCSGNGMKSMQFVRADGGWRISAAAWDDQRPGIGPPVTSSTPRRG